MVMSDYFMPTEGGDNAFTVEAPKIKFGAGSLSEVGKDAVGYGLKRVAVFTDPGVAGHEAVGKVVSSLKAAAVDAVLYEEAEVEPTDRSFKAATRFATEGNFDGFVSVGGGSVMDTAKAANLYSTYPDDFMAYVNAPIGDAKPVPGPLKPHIACPTTFGTASECTGIAICDFLDLELKSGIASPRLRPTLGVLDPDNLKTLPPLVVAANGFDVFSHAFESLTAKPFTQRARPDDPAKRPLSQGANPYSDIACQKAVGLVGEHLVRAVNDPQPEDYEALMFAGMLAGIGFGNAGCHLPHAMSYAVAGLVKNYHAAGWPSNHAMVPHGISVIVNAPAVFRFIGPACPDRHMMGAAAMGVDTGDLDPKDAGVALADRIAAMMKETGLPNGLRGVGYGPEDIDALTERANAQQRLIVNAPGPVGKEDLRKMFENSLELW